MLKWLQAILRDQEIPEELRTNLSEKSVLRAIEIQRQTIDSFSQKARFWEKAGVLDIPGTTIDLIDPHWYQFDFEPLVDEPYWVMTSLEARPRRKCD